MALIAAARRDGTAVLHHGGSATVAQWHFSQRPQEMHGGQSDREGGLIMRGCTALRGFLGTVTGAFIVVEQIAQADGPAVAQWRLAAHCWVQAGALW